MYTTKFVIILGVVGIVCGSDEFKIIDSIQQESPCNAQGGLCTIAADCPKGLLAEQRGLCPLQRSQGVECCYGTSVKETRCGKLGGQCRTRFCSEKLIKRSATDCPNNTKCCVLVK